MTDIYIENDSYDWFDRLDEMENSFKDIASSGKSIEDIVGKTKEYFLNRGYSINESIEEEDKYRFVFYDQDADESLIFILEAELGLYYASLGIHNNKVENIESYSTQDNPNEFFSMFIN